MSKHHHHHQNRGIVVAAVIERDGMILACQRLKSARHPLKWEFPGGKLEAGETPPEALQRELREELGIEATIGPELARYQFSYPHKSAIELIFFRVTEYQGEIRNEIFEAMRWCAASELPSLDFLEGDVDFVNRLARRNGSMSMAARSGSH
jgi:8-oxo-dGTP diphosphatase